jgi:hypothetical protein
MTARALIILSGSVFLFSSLVQESASNSNSPQSERQKRQYFGPVRKASTVSEIVSRILYRETTTHQRAVLDDTTAQFNSGGGFLAEEVEFDETGRLVSDADSDRDAEQEPFRSKYTYDANGRLSEEVQFDRDGSPAGKNQYVYDSDGHKKEELSYNSYGVLFSRERYDEHENVTDVEMLAPDGSIVRKESTAHTYRSNGHTLEDLYTPSSLPPGSYWQVAGPKSQSSDTSAITAPQLKTVYTYDDSGKLVKEVSEGREKNFDSGGRLTLELFGNARTTYSYDEHGRVAEMKVVEPAGELSISGGHGRYVYKYDFYGNPKETTIYNRDENVSQHYAYSYEYDSYGN